MSDRVNKVNLAGFSSKELTALSIRCLAVRKDQNSQKRAAGKVAAAKRAADRKAYLKAELAKLGG